jgi:hypothetical protein
VGIADMGIKGHIIEPQVLPIDFHKKVSILKNN